MPRVIVYLSEQEFGKLCQSAERDLRDLREQARYLIIKGLAAEVTAHVDGNGASSTPTTEAEAAHEQPA